MRKGYSVPFRRLFMLISDQASGWSQNEKVTYLWLMVNSLCIAYLYL
jgi:hypothetical protein